MNQNVYIILIEDSFVRDVTLPEWVSGSFKQFWKKQPITAEYDPYWTVVIGQDDDIADTICYNVAVSTGVLIETGQGY